MWCCEVTLEVSGKITAKRMISGLVLKYLNGERFVICGFYKFTLPASTEFNLTDPGYLTSFLEERGS